MTCFCVAGGTFAAGGRLFCRELSSRGKCFVTWKWRMLVLFGQKRFKNKKFYPKEVERKAHFTKRDKRLGKNQHEYMVSYPNQ